MHFNSGITVLATLLALAQSASCATTGTTATDLTSSQVVTSIQSVTKISASLNVSVSAVSTKTTAADMATIATSVTTGFTSIVSDVTMAVTMINGAKPFGENGADLVVDALLTVRIQHSIHQDLLSTVLGKHTIFAQFALTAPIVAVLSTLESGIDAFATALILLIPSKKHTAKEGFASLDVSVKSTIKSYSQFCIPSIFWPTIKPICV
ncbi:hypothetical protein BJ912DRAFT_1080487 [Pholiota molesta]|nr:hypothetical protein BJ912DRAFT_1080487 [Pholiota molesta]